MNLTNTAFPVFTQKGECHPDSAGFTKHELGTFMIAQGLVSKYNLKTPEDLKIIAHLSRELAAEILSTQ
jgi:hypothetical protein